MYKILFFSILWHFVLPEQNCINVRKRPVQFINLDEDFTPNRFPRASRVPSRAEKPVDCNKLHLTENTPFIAIILNRATGRLLCLGSIIDDQHILTAVKCIQHTNHKTLRILVGYFKAYWGRHSYVHYVESIIKHELDLAILKLTSPLKLSRTIRPIRLLRLEDGKPDDQIIQTRSVDGSGPYDGPGLYSSSELHSNPIDQSDQSLDLADQRNQNLNSTSKSSPKTRKRKTQLYKRPTHTKNLNYRKRSNIFADQIFSQLYGHGTKFSSLKSFKMNDGIIIIKEKLAKKVSSGRNESNYQQKKKRHSKVYRAENSSNKNEEREGVEENNEGEKIDANDEAKENDDSDKDKKDDKNIKAQGDEQKVEEGEVENNEAKVNEQNEKDVESTEAEEKVENKKAEKGDENKKAEEDDKDKKVEEVVDENKKVEEVDENKKGEEVDENKKAEEGDENKKAEEGDENKKAEEDVKGKKAEEDDENQKNEEDGENKKAEENDESNKTEEDDKDEKLEEDENKKAEEVDKKEKFTKVDNENNYAEEDEYYDEEDEEDDQYNYSDENNQNNDADKDDQKINITKSDNSASPKADDLNEKKVEYDADSSADYRKDKGDKKPKEIKPFKEKHSDVKTVFIVGFPLTNEDVVGDPIPQTLIYGMREENFTDDVKPCWEMYKEKPSLKEDEDPKAENKFFCTKGESKFCWGCLGGPSLWKKDKEYIQVGVIIGTKCESKDKLDPYLHSRVDIHIKWISKNSYVHFRN